MSEELVELLLVLMVSFVTVFEFVFKLLELVLELPVSLVEVLVLGGLVLVLSLPVPGDVELVVTLLDEWMVVSLVVPALGALPDELDPEVPLPTDPGLPMPGLFVPLWLAVLVVFVEETD